MSAIAHLTVWLPFDPHAETQIRVLSRVLTSFPIILVGFNNSL